MSTCEKCWEDAALAEATRGVSKAGEYMRLVANRKNHPCSAEEQAGPSAGRCPECGRMTLHQHTAEPMCRCPGEVRRFNEQTAAALAARFNKERKSTE